MSKRAEENYENLKKNKIIKIGVIGNSNIGKSFILSKLSKTKLPSGSSIKTIGLSIKYPDLEQYKDRKIVLIDSAGLETPVLNEEENKKEEDNNEEEENKKQEENNEEEEKNDENQNMDENRNNNRNQNKNEILNNNETENRNKSLKNVNKNSENENKTLDNIEINEIFKEKSREKLITELFLRNYIINNSDILIIVVGQLTYSEQKLLIKIKNEIKRNNINKPLFIIHNLMNFITVEQVNNYIKETLLKCVTFDLEEGHKISTKTQSKLGVYFYEKNSNPKIFHLIFANEGSKAGNYFNDFTLEKLEENFIGVTDLKNFDAVESVKERFIEISKEIIETNESAITKNDFENSEKKMIKLNTSKDIVLKKYYIDELGFSNLKINGFEPTYNYYKKEKDNQIIIRVEVPGNFELLPEIEYSGQYTKIKLTGEKKKDKEP